MGHRLTLTELLLQGGVPEYVEPAVGSWDVGRLVLAPEYRSDVGALRHCLFIALKYACQHVQIDGIYASCTHVLGRLYRRFGFTVFAKNVPFPGTEKTYALIHGSTSKVLTALAGESAIA